MRLCECKGLVEFLIPNTHHEIAYLLVKDTEIRMYARYVHATWRLLAREPQLHASPTT